MIYIFKDKELVRTYDKFSDPDHLNWCYPKAIPTDGYVFDSDIGKWYVKRTRAHVRPLPDKHVPKELKMVLLLMGVPV